MLQASAAPPPQTHTYMHTRTHTHTYTHRCCCLRSACRGPTPRLPGCPPLRAAARSSGVARAPAAAALLCRGGGAGAARGALPALHPGEAVGRVAAARLWLWRPVGASGRARGPPRASPPPAHPRTHGHNRRSRAARGLLRCTRTTPGGERQQLVHRDSLFSGLCSCVPRPTHPSTAITTITNTHPPRPAPPPIHPMQVCFRHARLGPHLAGLRAGVPSLTVRGGRRRQQRCRERRRFHGGGGAGGGGERQRAGRRRRAQPGAAARLRV